MRYDKRLFEYVSPAVRTSRRDFQQVLRFHGIRAGHAVENIIEKELRIFGVAMLAKCNEVLSLPHYSVCNEYDDLFLGTYAKVFMWHENMPTQPVPRNVQFAEGPAAVSPV
jgi:hypothetical protein